MSRFLAVTLGNTTAAAAVAPDGKLGEVTRVPVGEVEALRPALESAVAGDEDVPVVVASVTPPVLGTFAALVMKVTGRPPLVAGRDFPIPIEIDVEEPAKVGVDRLLGALAAWRRCERACIVVDAGTAVTVDAVSGEGVFLGGAIFPGPGLMARSLAEGTAQLPLVQPDRLSMPPHAIGRDTEQAIRSGIMQALSGGLVGLVRDMADEVGKRPVVYITGGYAPPPGDGGDAPWTVSPELVLEGLVLAFGERPEP